MSAPSALASRSVRSEPGTRIMSPKQVKITPSCSGDRHAVVHPAHRDHADRAPRPVDELDVVGEQVVDPVLVDRVGVPAAHLHQLVVAARLDRRQDLGGEGAAELGVADTRRRTSTQRSSASRPGVCGPVGTIQAGDCRAGVDQQLVADRHRADQGDLDGFAPVLLGRAERQASRGVEGEDLASARRRLHRSRSRPRGRNADRDPGPTPVPLWRSLDNARPQFLQLLLVVGAHALEELPRGFRFLPRRPSRSRIRRGSGPSRRVHAPPPSASRRPMLTLRRTPATST